MKVTPPPPGRIGARVDGFDPRTCTREQASELRQLVYRHKLLVFKNIELDDLDYIAMARKFGRPQIYHQAHYHHPGHPEIFVSSNVPMDGKKVGVASTGRFWHSDYQFFDEPLSTTFVFPKIIPEGRRATCYVDMVQALKTLPPHLRAALEHATCFHESVMYYKVQPWDIDRAIAELMAEFRRHSPGAHHPAIITHPVTGESALYISEGFTMSVDGIGHERSQALLREVFEHLNRPELVQEHEWGAGDLMFWDNRQLNHMAAGGTPGQPSRSYRIGVYDGLPFYVGCKLEETRL